MSKCSHCGADRDAIGSIVLERELLHSLLSEASDWICGHPGVPKDWKWDGTRYWCDACSNYVRTEEEFSLRDRIRAVLNKE